MGSIVYFLVGLVLMVMGIVLSFGAVLPREHVVTRSADLRASPQAVWTLISEPDKFPSWRSSVTSVEVLSSANEPAKWVESSGSDRLKLAVVEAKSRETLVTRIDDDKLPYGGTWTFTLRPSAGEAGSHLEITEQGFVNPPPFRFLAKFVFGHATTIERYLADLRKRLEADRAGQ
jgi:uncharacterized protein YndB with AHSA1/START domain